MAQPWMFMMMMMMKFRKWRKFEIKKMDFVPQKNCMDVAHGDFVIGSV
jgi:hypothetical protein